MTFAENKRALQSDRKQGNPAREAAKEMKELAAAATPAGFISLITQIQMGDWPYVLALFAAAFKDLLNFIEVTVFLFALVIVLTFLTSIFIFFMMLLASFSENGKGASARKKGKQTANMMKRGIILLGGTIIELLPGINFIPWEVITVFIIYGMVLAARKQAGRVIAATKKSWA